MPGEEIVMKLSDETSRRRAGKNLPTGDRRQRGGQAGGLRNKYIATHTATSDTSMYTYRM